MNTINFFTWLESLVKKTGKLTFLFSQLQEQFLQVLSDSVRTRVETIPRCHDDKLTNDNSTTSAEYDKREPSLGILFSGGIDSVVLAALAHR